MHPAPPAVSVADRASGAGPSNPWCALIRGHHALQSEGVPPEPQPEVTAGPVPAAAVPWGPRGGTLPHTGADVLDRRAAPYSRLDLA